jgi:phage baseplate assembly protein W
MPIPQVIRVNPLDLQKNIAIGVSLPFGVCGTDQLFNKTYSTKDQTKSNLINLLLTNKGERVLNPNFGSNLKQALFEQITQSTEDDIRNIIISSASIYIPEISIVNIDINNTYVDNNTINITINYILNISGTADQITIQFQ